MDTIVAAATANGRGAITIIRLSGDNAFDIAKKVFNPFPDKPRFMKRGIFSAQYFCDDGMCACFPAPNSYTGEDSVEFYLHGGIAITDGAIRACIENGARLALNGEFSKRAFLNGKMTLDGAEGVIGMIEAESAAAVRCGYNLLQGRLNDEITNMQNKLTDLIAETEVSLDYPEEDLELMTTNKLIAPLKDIYTHIEKLHKSSSIAPLIKNGANIAIIGAVNTGKSSLLNALTDSERAIVSDIQGTTRDIVSMSTIYKDLKINYSDTAGLRETEDVIEKEGIKRAKSMAENADMVLFVTNNIVSDNEMQYLNSLNKPYLIIYNKCDIISYPDSINSMCVSAKNGKNIDNLKEYIYNIFKKEIPENEIVISNARQSDCLSRAEKSLSNAINAASNATLDCIAPFLYEAWHALGEITGTDSQEEIVDRIFSRFCLGK